MHASFMHMPFERSFEKAAYEVHLDQVKDALILKILYRRIHPCPCGVALTTLVTGSLYPTRRIGPKTSISRLARSSHAGQHPKFFVKWYIVDALGIAPQHYGEVLDADVFPRAFYKI